MFDFIRFVPDGLKDCIWTNDVEGGDEGADSLDFRKG